MNVSRFMTALVWIALFAVPVSAADLAKIERTIAKEPVYQSRPKYCLLVFGPEAKPRVWLVQDGGTLYIDRNSNGDLTEEGEKVAATKGDSTDAEQGVFYFEAGDIRDGTLLHKNLQITVWKFNYRADSDEQVKAYLAKDPKARGCSLHLDVEMPGWKGSGLGERVRQYVSFRDTNGFLQFGDKPQEAPVIHFGGPWQITLFEQQKLMVGRQTDLALGVGTPGLGAGTFAYVAYERVIPEEAYPKVEITYLPKGESEPPVKELYELKHRC